MSHTIELIENGKVIKTRFHRETQPDEIQSVMSKNLEMAKRHQTSLFLVDCTELKDETSYVFENYEVGVMLAEMQKQLPARLKDALILPRSEKAAENLRFFETVTLNRGMDVRTFEKETDALAWLLNR